MFEGFHGVWTSIALSKELPEERALSREVASTPIVIFRAQDMQRGALIDRCPHRNVALSLGKVQNGCIECPFHGWRFDRYGANVATPWNPKARHDRLGAKALPVAEHGGLIWVKTTDDVHPIDAPQLPPELLNPHLRRFTTQKRFNAHWSRVVESMLDDAHLAFVHTNTIGKNMLRDPTDQLTHHITDHPWGFEWTTAINGTPQGFASEFRWPNMVKLRVELPKKLLAIFFIALPITPHQTQVFQIGLRDFARIGWLDAPFKRFNARVLLEDQAVIESSPDEIPPAVQERSVPTDVMALRFRKRYFQELRSSRIKEQPYERAHLRHR